jgi:hypothetical protein
MTEPGEYMHGNFLLPVISAVSEVVSTVYDS